MQLRYALARVGPRWRLAAAAVCLLLAGVSALEGRVFSPSGPRGRTIVVAGRDLAAGRSLTAADLATVRATRSWPGVVAAPRPLLGRRLATALRRGEPVTGQRLLSPGLTRGLGPGVVALPVDIASDVRGLVMPGGRVDLLAVAAGDDPPSRTDAAGRGAERVAEGLLVLAVLPPDPSADGGCRLVLAPRRDTAVRIVGLRGARLFQVLTLPP